MLDNNQIIERTADIQDMYEKSTTKKVKLTTVRKVLRTEFDMRYRKMVKLAPLANKERCRV